uniref:Globin family profile domain-containing protein n=1 Tax=Acrobeloides nanus TaxID=290746 RepID=A0A914DF78_9BILA
MGNESSMVIKTHPTFPKKGGKGKLRSKRSKSVLTEQNGCTGSFDSDTTTENSSSLSVPNLAKTAANSMPATNGYIKNGMNGKKRSMLGKTQTIEIDDSMLETPNVNHLQVPDRPITPGRKGSYCNGMSSLTIQNGNLNSRRRSRSLCAQQMKNDCQAIAMTIQNSGTGLFSSRRSSGGIVPSLARLRIQQCYKNSKSTIGHQILKRACVLRPDVKMFISYLSPDKVDELANDVYAYLTDCVNNIEDQEKVKEISWHFGEIHAQLCNYGFRPEFFSTIADATIAECVRLDGGAHKRCETLLAWSQLMAVMFSHVRDGYYAQIRMNRRSSLPQNKYKSSSIELKNTSFDMDL